MHGGSLPRKQDGDRCCRPVAIWIFPCGPRSTAQHTVCYLTVTVVDKPFHLTYHFTDEKAEAEKLTDCPGPGAWQVAEPGLSQVTQHSPALCPLVAYRPGRPARRAGSGGWARMPPTPPSNCTGVPELVPFTPWCLSPRLPLVATSCTRVCRASTEGRASSSGPAGSTAPHSPPLSS